MTRSSPRSWLHSGTSRPAAFSPRKASARRCCPGDAGLPRVNSSSDLQVYINNASQNIVSVTAPGFALQTSPIVLMVTWAGTRPATFTHQRLRWLRPAARRGPPASGNPGGTLQLGASVDLHQYFGGKNRAAAAQAVDRVLTPTGNHRGLQPVHDAAMGSTCP